MGGAGDRAGGRGAVAGHVAGSARAGTVRGRVVGGCHAGLTATDSLTEGWDRPGFDVRRTGGIDRDGAFLRRFKERVDPPSHRDPDAC